MHASTIRNIYMFVKKDKVDDCVKYGIKLSEYSNVFVKTETLNKSGILAYISPKDSDLYNNVDYDILRIKVDSLNIFVHNSSLVKSSENVFHSSNVCTLKKYKLGEYINPELIICSTILPENIFKYNKILDVPLLVENSKELYIAKENAQIEEEINSNFTFDMLKEKK